MEIIDNVLIKVTDDDIRTGTFIIPNYIKKICSSAFEDCSRLICVIIPKSVEEIGNRAFQNCKNLEKVYISYGLVKICFRAFYNCENLKKITIPASVKCIENCVFDSDFYLHKVKLILETTLFSINFNSNRDIYIIKVGRIAVNNTKKFARIRKQEILTKIKEKLKIKNINNKYYFKYKEHEPFIKMMLNELNNDVYINFEYQLDNYINEFIKNKQSKIESHENTPLKCDDEIKKEYNLEYPEDSLLQENKKTNETSLYLEPSINTQSEIREEKKQIVSKESKLENNNLEVKEQSQKENNIKEILTKLKDLTEEDIALILDMVKNNLFDKNIINYINMSREEKLKCLESQSQYAYKVSLEKEPIEEYKARQKIKKN